MSKIKHCTRHAFGGNVPCPWCERERTVGYSSPDWQSVAGELDEALRELVELSSEEYRATIEHFRAVLAKFTEAEALPIDTPTQEK